MSASYNQITIVGNLVRDPEIKYTQAGKAYTRFTLAVNRNIAKSADGKQQTDFIRVVTWDKLAETCNTYLKKGMSCLISGRLQIDTYEKDGAKRESAEVNGLQMQMLGGRGTSENGSTNGAASNGTTTELTDELEENVIPF